MCSTVFSLTMLLLVAISSAANIPPRSSWQNNRGITSAFRSMEQSFDYKNNPRREMDRNAKVLKEIKEDNDQGYYYGFETSNGIMYQESKSGSGFQGSYSYKGDDGQTYTIVFTSGDQGFQASGAHIPTPPPVPQEILEGLRKNQEDEARGIFDDGKYNPAKYDNGDYKRSFSGNRY